MHIATCHIVGVSPYSPSRAHQAEKHDRETHDAHDLRTWREKAHCREDGRVLVPAMAFKQALDRAATMRGEKIPGKGASTYARRFKSGVLILEPLLLDATKDKMDSVRIHANADGVRGSGKRVWRTFPVINQWGGELTIHILDDMITAEVFERHLIEAGQFVGVGRFRPVNGGVNGRFEVKRVDWQ